MTALIDAAVIVILTNCAVASVALLVGVIVNVARDVRRR